MVRVWLKARRVQSCLCLSKCSAQEMQYPSDASFYAGDNAYDGEVLPRGYQHSSSKYTLTWKSRRGKHMYIVTCLKLLGEGT
jgi:hypothetical protein